MKLRALLIALIVATSAILVDHASPARAATINFDASGDVSGITGLDVGGSLFDIAFIFGGAKASYNTAYGSTLTVYDGPEALQVRQAITTLLHKVDVGQLIPGIAGTTGDFSGFLIPIFVEPDAAGGIVQYLSATQLRVSAGSAHYVHFSGLFISFDSTPTSTYAWTVITPIATSEVPLPAALPLFATGLGVMVLLARRRKRKSSAAIAT